MWERKGRCEINIQPSTHGVLRKKIQRKPECSQKVCQNKNPVSEIRDEMGLAKETDPDPTSAVICVALGKLLTF